MAIYRLAEDLGIWDVEGLMREMSMRQLNEWLVYRDLRNREELENRLDEKAAANRENAHRLL